MQPLKRDVVVGSLLGSITLPSGKTSSWSLPLEITRVNVFETMAENVLRIVRGGVRTVPSLKHMISEGDLMIDMIMCIEVTDLRSDYMFDKET